MFNKKEFSIVGDLKVQYSFYRCILELIEKLTGKEVIHESYETTPVYFYDSTGKEVTIVHNDNAFTITPKEVGMLITYYVATKKGFSALVNQLDMVIPELLTKNVYEGFFVKVNWRELNINNLKQVLIES